MVWRHIHVNVKYTYSWYCSDLYILCRSTDYCSHCWEAHTWWQLICGDDTEVGQFKNWWVELITQYLNKTCNLYGCHLFPRIDNITIFPSAGYYNSLYNFMRLGFFKHQSKWDFKNKLLLYMQYYCLPSFLLLCYLHEPLVVKTVELHKLLLYVRWPPQAVHLWPWIKLHTWTYSGAEVFNAQCSSSLMSSVNTNNHDHACQNALALCVQPTSFRVWAWPSINSKPSLDIIELTANPHQLPYFLE